MPNLIFSGKYIVQDVLAKGGMGVIYKALDRTLNRIVVIKVVHEHLSGDPSFTERFLREARAMARLDHENIITIHAVEEEHGVPYIVMEYFPGGNLRSFTQASEALPLRTSIEIALQVSDALAYAHEQGIIHRDIKPANILFDGRGRVKLTDFGIAAALDEVSITTVGQVIGTPEYMSPEQAGSGKVDGRADLYSLGIVLYEMVVGHHPFRNLPKSIVQSKLIDANQDISLDFPPNIPSLVKGIIEDLVRREREYRTPTARMLVSQLKECLQTLPSPPESSEGEHTILVRPHTDSKREGRMAPFVSSEPPLYQASPSHHTPSKPHDEPRRSDDFSGHALGRPENKTGMAAKPRAPGRPETHHVPQSWWQGYNVLPLLTTTLATVLALGGLVLYLNRSDWPQSPTPRPSLPGQDTQTVDRTNPDQGKQRPGKSSEGLGSEDSHKQVVKPKPETRPPVRLPSDTKVITPSRQQLDRILEDFQSAYEAQDSSSLRRLSDIGPDRQLFLDMMSNNYSVIKTSIQNVSVTNDQATASLFHEELVDKNGEEIAPDRILQKITLTVRREGDHWSKVVW